MATSALLSDVLGKNMLEYIPKDIENLLLKFVKEQQPEVITKIIVSGDFIKRTPEREHIPGTIYYDEYIFLRVSIKNGGMEHLMEIAHFEECDDDIKNSLTILNSKVNPKKDMTIYKNGNSNITISFINNEEYPIVIECLPPDYTNGRQLIKFKWENRWIIKEIFTKLIEISQIEIREPEDISDDEISEYVSDDE